jgi:hypothetical protein
MRLRSAVRLCGELGEEPVELGHLGAQARQVDDDPLLRRSSTTIASSSGEGFSSRCGT